MESSMTTTTKTMRADARRNRDKLVAAALALFTERGSEVALEAVAKRAGVGVGTLYRHFPTRDALVEAVYLNELDRLHEGAAELLASHPADEALERWLDLFVQYAVTKRGLAGGLRSIFESGGNLHSQARTKIVDALSSLLDAAATEGTIRSDLDPEDVLLAMGGIWSLPDEPDWAGRARRLLGLVMDGLRYRA
jgi:AcrR family transcriptional regulator